MNCLARDQGLSRQPPTAIGRSNTVKGKAPDLETAWMVRRPRWSSIYELDKAISLRSGWLISSTLQVYPWSCEDFHIITPNPITNTVKFFLDKGPPRRVHPVPPTEGSGIHGNGVPPPIVSRLGSSGESGSHEILWLPLHHQELQAQRSYVKV